MKLITYALFNGNAAPYEKAAYIRGFYFNCRMNNLIYPDWRTHLEVDRSIYNDYKDLFDWLVENNTLSLHINEETPVLCEGMFWRMKPLFTQDVSHILCRDTDSITTYREAKCVQHWIQRGNPVHAILDNPAHGGMMGGMVGFDTSYFKAITGWESWEQMINGYNLTERGSDQHFMNEKIYPLIKGSLLLHCLSGAPMSAEHVETNVPNINLPQVNANLWESDLTCRHIGSAGVVDLEVLRFFQRMDEYNWKYQPIEKKFYNIFYWQQ